MHKWLHHAVSPFHPHSWDHQRSSLCCETLALQSEAHQPWLQAATQFWISPGWIGSRNCLNLVVNSAGPSSPMECHRKFLPSAFAPKETWIAQGLKSSKQNVPHLEMWMTSFHPMNLQRLQFECEASLNLKKLLCSLQSHFCTSKRQNPFDHPHTEVCPKKRLTLIVQTPSTCHFMPIKEVTKYLRWFHGQNEWSLSCCDFSIHGFVIPFACNSSCDGDGLHVLCTHAHTNCTCGHSEKVHVAPQDFECPLKPPVVEDQSLNNYQHCSYQPQWIKVWTGLLQKPCSADPPTRDLWGPSEQHQQFSPPWLFMTKKSSKVPPRPSLSQGLRGHFRNNSMSDRLWHMIYLKLWSCDSRVGNDSRVGRLMPKMSSVCRSSLALQQCHDSVDNLISYNVKIIASESVLWKIMTALWIGKVFEVSCIFLCFFSFRLANFGNSKILLS